MNSHLSSEKRSLPEDSLDQDVKDGLKKAKVESLTASSDLNGEVSPISFTNTTSTISSSSSSSSPISQESGCSLCFKEGVESNPILDSHNCPVCVPSAWKICMECDSKLLSRSCPVCRSDYAPQLFYAFPGPPLCTISDGHLDLTSKRLLMLKLTLLKSILCRSNILVWSPSDTKMFYSFPGNEENDESHNKQDAQFCVGEVIISGDHIKNKIFSFTNKIWDEIVNQSEEGNECFTTGAGKALKFIVDATKANDSILFTNLNPETVEFILEESSNQIENVQSN